MQDPIVVSTWFQNVIIPLRKDNGPCERKAVNRVVLDANPMEQKYKDTFINQRKFGKDVAKCFLDKKVVNVLALAPTQSGKTGSMVALCYECLKTPELAVPKDNIFVFTGLSSREWVNQTQQRFPSWMSDHICHRNNLPYLLECLRGKKNVLIIVDEAHIAAKKNQSLFKLYHALKVYDITNLYENDIKIVQFTATPDQLQQSMPLLFGNNAHRVAHMQVPDNYVSAQWLRKQDRVWQAKKLYDEEDPDKALDNIREIAPVALDGQPAYHIIRTDRGKKHAKTIEDFKKVFGNCEFISEPSVQKSVQQLIREKPNKNTFIFIKDKLRCAQTIQHKWVRVLYDRAASKQKKEALLQGLWGRATGFHNNKGLRVWVNAHVIEKLEEKGEWGEGCVN